MDFAVVLAGLIVGFTVGLTGMGGGALMTPILVLFFNITPMAAVSSDLVAAAVMKPVGSAVHMRQGTIHWPLVRWLMVGSVPSAFAGVLLLRLIGDEESLHEVVSTALGIALLIAAAGLVVKAYRTLLARSQRKAARALGVPLPREAQDDVAIVVRKVPTVLIGVAGGLIVGMTSVGSGSLIILGLLAIYPTLTANKLVGTDLVQAVPLVASAALGHILFGDFQLNLTLAILVGSIPGVYLGAKVSSRAPGWIIRRALAVVLTASGLKLLGVPTVTLGIIISVVVIAGPLAWMALRKYEARRAVTRLQASESQPVAVAAQAEE